MSYKITRRSFVKTASTLAALSVLPKAASSAGEPVRIGLEVYTEGPALENGRKLTRGFKTAISYINGKGGILGGRMVEGVIASQGLTGETAKAAALRLVQRDRVKALFGPNYSDNAPAGLSVAQRYLIPFAPDQGGMWLYEQGYKGTLGLSYNARMRTLPQIRWMEKKGYKSVVLLLSDIDYCRDVERFVREAWEKSDSKVKLLDVIYVPFGQTQLQVELTKAIGSNPDFIWSEEWSVPVSVAVMKICHDLLYRGGISVTCSIDQSVIDEVPPEISEGVFCHFDYAPDPNVPENKAFLDTWAAEWGENEVPFRFEEITFSQTTFLLLAMDKAGTDGDGTQAGIDKIYNGMRQVDWISPRGKIRLTDSNLGLFELTPMTQIKSGKITIGEYLNMTPNDHLPTLPVSWDGL